MKNNRKRHVLPARFTKLEDSHILVQINTFIAGHTPNLTLAIHALPLRPKHPLQPAYLPPKHPIMKPIIPISNRIRRLEKYIMSVEERSILFPEDI
jgi:hypothetical protein